MLKIIMVSVYLIFFLPLLHASLLVQQSDDKMINAPKSDPQYSHQPIVLETSNLQSVSRDYVCFLSMRVVL